MPIDTSIYGQIQQPQPVNALANLAQAYQVRGLQAGLEREERAAESQNRLMQLVQDPSFSSMNARDQAAKLRSGAFFDQAGKVITDDARANKENREGEKAQLEGMLKKFEVSAQIMSGVSDQASWERARALTAQTFGQEAAAKMPPQYDPALIQENLAKAMSVKDQVEQRYKALTFGETQRHNQATEANAVRGQNLSADTARRGQDMVDTRAKDQAQAGRVPSGYRQAADGTLEFIPGGPADPASKAGGGKPLTEGQSKALLFGTRMQEANDILEGLAAKGTDRPGLIKQGADAVGLGGAANWTQSGNQQQVEQAQRDFINATLRRESGAAIAASEFENARQQYFPAIGDSEAVKAQKKRNREVAMRGILAEVPDGDARVTQVRGEPAAPKPATGGVINVTNAADYAKVPSGATYTTPDGKTRRKP